MKPLDDILARARTRPRHVVLAEGEDPRIVGGGLRAVRDGMARITLVGDTARVTAMIAKSGGSGADFEIADPMTSPLTNQFAAEYLELRKHKGIDEGKALDAMRERLGYAAMMVRLGHADGTVGGAVETTSETVRAALQIIGRAADAQIVSSFFLMMLCEHHHTKKGGFVFADCGLIIEPDAHGLSQIAILSAKSFKSLVGDEPRVAMLSFSTAGSARHDRVDKVTTAARLTRDQCPDLLVDGDLQFDAAFLPAVSVAKAPGSPLGGAANVMVFPNLEAANIGYKIAERIGGAKAIGPILQGLAKPANDLSRGCSADDVYHMIAVTVVQAQIAEANATTARAAEDLP